MSIVIEDKSYFKNKKILVTGAAGTIGQNFLLTIKDFNLKKIIGIDNDDKNLVKFQNKISKFKNIQLVHADIRNKKKIENCFHKIDFVLHLAALKHLPLCEKLPYEAMENNIEGTKNIISLCKQFNVKKVLFSSTDKAVNPSNTLGITKLMGEKLFYHENNNLNSKCKFSTLRFGNVVGSSGSVIPIFHNQIKNKQNLTVTNSKMTRFVMTIDEAVQFLIKSLIIMKGGEIFVTKMKSLRIENLAKAMIQYYGPSKSKIDYIGMRKGEKIFEELITETEYKKIKSYKNLFIISEKNNSNKKVHQNLRYTSLDKNQLNIDQIKILLKKIDKLRK